MKGEVFGISLFIANTQCAVSLLRRQCFWNNEDESREQRLFAGISWVPHSTVPREAVRNIEQVFGSLASLLYECDFRGFANFDFILTDTGEVLVIECNPRLSSATPQIFAFPDVLGTTNVSKDFLTATLHPAQLRSLPEVQMSRSEYSGSLLDIPASGNGAVRKIFPNGIYRCGSDGIVFVDADVRRISMHDPDLCIVYSEAQIGDRFQRDETIVSVLSNVPLFEPDGTVNKQGFELVEYFQYE